jgi:glycosyltransferase involved in cell wall biosynthesis
MKPCILIPHYDHAKQFERILPQLRDTGLPLVVVDDHSPEPEWRHLADLLTRMAPDAHLVRHAANRGKGGAVKTGLATALDLGYSHAVQIDADGQHDLDAAGRLLDRATERPEALICGLPQFDESIPAGRYYARFLTLGLTWVESLGREIQDAMCGFRVYPLHRIVPIIRRHRLGERMDFDPEILVRAVWTGIELVYVPVRVVYPDEGRSHFMYLRDNLRITWMHVRLVAGMLLRSPMLIRRRWQRR